MSAARQLVASFPAPGLVQPVQPAPYYYVVGLGGRGFVRALRQHHSTCAQLLGKREAALAEVTIGLATVAHSHSAGAAAAGAIATGTPLEPSRVAAGAGAARTDAAAHGRHPLWWLSVRRHRGRGDELRFAQPPPGSKFAEGSCPTAALRATSAGRSLYGPFIRSTSAAGKDLRAVYRGGPGIAVGLCFTVSR